MWSSNETTSPSRDELMSITGIGLASGDRAEMGDVSLGGRRLTSGLLRSGIRKEDPSGFGPDSLIKVNIISFMIAQNQSKTFTASLNTEYRTRT